MIGLNLYGDMAFLENTICFFFNNLPSISLWCSTLQLPVNKIIAINLLIQKPIYSLILTFSFFLK
jgi:hypothetical protein